MKHIAEWKQETATQPHVYDPSNSNNKKNKQHVTSSRDSIADGFSSLAMRRTLSPVSWRNSTMSAGCCTNDRATQSTSPSRDRMNAKSL